MSDPRSTPADPRPPSSSGAPGSSGPLGSTSPTSPPPATGTSTSGKPGKPGKDTSKPAKSNGLEHTRTSGLWVAVVAAGLLLILLVVFIVQNTQRVRVEFLGWDGSPPLAVALLVATAAGILITGLAGSLRIFQLRRRVKRSNR